LKFEACLFAAAKPNVDTQFEGWIKGHEEELAFMCLNLLMMFVELSDVQDGGDLTVNVAYLLYN
jgi:hypothetical protein